MLLPASTTLRRFLPLFAIAAAWTMAGCTPESARWTPAEAPKENKVDFVSMSHRVHFLPGTTAPSPAETKDLAKFLDDVALAYGDQVTVDAGPHSSAAGVDALAAKRVNAVIAALRKMRVRAQPASHPTVEGALSRDGVVVTIARYVVTGPNCPDRTKISADDFTNTPPSNFGCATATNLGLMVANPGDLVRGSVPGGADGEFATRGVQLYRAGGIDKTLAAPVTSVTGGAN